MLLTGRAGLTAHAAAGLPGRPACSQRYSGTGSGSVIFPRWTK